MPCTTMLRSWACACGLLFLVAGVVVAAEPLVDIPQVWRKAPKSQFIWYRCAVFIPQDWEKEEIVWFSEPIDDAREFYVQGMSVAAAGNFPPNYRSGLGAEEEHFVEPAFRYGDWNVVSIRVYSRSGRTNFNVAAPAFFAGKEAIHLAGKWEARFEDDVDWGRKASPEAIATAARYNKINSADEIRNLLKRIQGEDGPKSPAETLPLLETPEDLTVDVVLSEPQIGQPLSFKFDGRGRLWLVQYLQYPNPAGLKPLSRDKYLRTVYDKVPPPPPNHFRGRDKITIHEDTNGDGKYDAQKTFVDGLNIMTSFAIDRDGVWVLNPPYLLFYPDRDNDDRPDGPPEVHLSGFGLQDSHSVVNSLRWGPDGWLYACQGSTVTAHVKKPGSKDLPQHSMGQLVWRYHPRLRKYEVFAEGGGNAFGLEIDAVGNIFSGTNGGNSRGFHYVQGGYARKGFGKHGELSNPYAFGYFEDMEHHAVQRFTHTFLIYQDDALPKRYHGRLFGVEPLQGRVVMSEVVANGTTFKTKDLEHVFRSRDPWVRPVDIQSGPDGAIYVADFYEQRIDHASHYQGRVHKTSGRIYRLRGKNQAAGKSIDFAALSSAALVEKLKHPQRWHRQQAQRTLAMRQDKDIVGSLRRGLASGESTFALECLWAYHNLGALSEGDATALLAHPVAHVRSWTVRLVCDDGLVSAALAQELAERTTVETDVRVLNQLAASARRLSSANALPIVAALAGRDDHERDPYLPLMVWWALERQLQQSPDAVVRLCRSPDFWNNKLATEHLLGRIARRLAARGTQADFDRCAELFSLAKSTAHRRALLAGFEQAFLGRSMSHLSPKLNDVLARLEDASLVFRLRQGTTAAVEEAIALLESRQAKVSEQSQIVEVLGQIRATQSLPVLLRLAASGRDRALRLAALNALQNFRDMKIADTLLAKLDEMPQDTQESALLLLASRQAWAAKLAAAAGEHKFAVSENVVNQLRLLGDSQIVRQVAPQAAPRAPLQAADVDRIAARYVSLVDSGAGNPYDGKRLFGQSCGKCHVLFNEGGNVGPDLTAYQRTDLKRLIRNVIHPSLEIREGYENYVFILDDGRTLSGFIVDKNEHVVVVRNVDGRTTTLARDEIDEMRALKESVMPSGLLAKYSSQQIRDLFSYLQSVQPLP